jgi:putative protease
MSKHPTPRPELLAPAGSPEAFFAAMEAGADAVYTGLREFSARAKAKNVTLEELEKMVGYARSLGRKVFVTLNTLVKEGELPLLVETLSALEGMAVGGVILQDLAVWRLAREHFPALELHASTQMTVHNAAGVRMLERMGFSRAVLARELSIAEIAAIRKETTIDLEHFIHGALCFSFSGQCYFSSWLGGKSGNRGRCAQPCRRRYRYRQQDGYYFSTNDLSAIDLLPELSAAGVMSFKIEGRMKSAEYVASVVGAYRKVLDAPSQQRTEALREAKELLKLSFGRLPTKGFLPGGVPTDIAIPALKGATGRFLGDVTAVKGGAVSFKTRDRIHIGDRIRIQPKTDRAGTAFTVKELFLGQRSVKVAQAGSLVTAPSTFRGVFQVGDTVFKVSSEQAFNMSEQACRRKLTHVSPPPRPARLFVELHDDTLCVRAENGPDLFERRYPVETYPASDSPLNAATLRSVFEKTGGSPFVLENLSTGELPAVVIPPSRLKEIRRDFYADLLQAQVDGEKKVRRHQVKTALGALLPATTPHLARERQFTVGIRDIRDIQIVNDQNIDRVLLPLTPGNLQGFYRLGRRLAGKEASLIWDLPFFLTDGQWGDYREAIRTLTTAGFTTFRLNNLGHFPLFDGLSGITLITGYRLFSLNSQALLAWRELGATEATLYIEDDRDNLGAILRRDAGITQALTVYSTVALITSRIPIRNVRSDTPVVSDRSEGYRVDSRSGLSVVTPENDFSLIGRLNELQDLGCGHFTADISHLGPFSEGGKKVLDALRRDTPVPGTSLFNYESGLE